MKFRTEMAATPSALQLEPYAPLTFTGSCFSDNIARCFSESLWPARNPFGVLYNPASIAMVLRRVLLDDESKGMALFRVSCFRRGDVWLSWWFDSRFNAVSAEGLMERFAAMRRDVRAYMEKSAALFVTFGTAWCYSRHGESADSVVSNCHKQPAAMFTRFRMDCKSISDMCGLLLRDLHEAYPRLAVVFTVSPVRHLKDGMHANTLSKATLQLAVDRILQEAPEGMNVSYYPAYELVTDDLRDYRFYASDLAHPSEQAVEYIWEHLTHTFMNESARHELAKGLKLGKRMRHRSITGAPDEAFAAETRALLALFMHDHPDAFIDPSL